MKKTRSRWFEVLETLLLAGGLPRRVLLYGPPGTGKTSFPFSLFGEGSVESVTCCRGMSPSDLLGQFLLVKGETVWTDGPAVRAMRRGACLLLNELGSHDPELEPVLHSILDDERVARVSLPNGEMITPHRSFVVIGTTNETPQDSLGQALFDRFDLMLPAFVPAPGIIESLPEQLRHVVQNKYMSLSPPECGRTISVRSVMSFSRILPHLGEGVAAELIFGARAAEFLSAVGTAQTAQTAQGVKE